jgi:hypothetical protein
LEDDRVTLFRELFGRDVDGSAISRLMVHPPFNVDLSAQSSAGHLLVQIKKGQSKSVRSHLDLQFSWSAVAHVCCQNTTEVKLLSIIKYNTYQLYI